MWKKEDEQPPQQQPARESDRKTPAGTSSPSTGPGASATIGPSITIKGDVTGDEDLLIQGRVDGMVDLEQHAVTVGHQGRVKAAIRGRVVTVEGEVEGDLEADEQVILRSKAHVVGDITSPRVVLEDGASFKGLVDMSSPAGSGGSGKGSGSSSGTGSTGSSSSSSSSGSSGSSSSSSTSGSSKSSDSSSAKSSAKTEKAAS